MGNFNLKALVLSAAIAGAAAPSALATVSLAFDDGDTFPTLATVAPGVNFSVNLRLTSSTVNDKVTGVNYDLIAVRADGVTTISNAFKIVSRSLTSPASAYGDQPVVSDASLANKLLTPDTNSNLGGSVVDVNTPTSTGTFQVAAYVLQAVAGLQAGTYKILTEAPGNNTDPSRNSFIGYNGPGPGFDDFPFNQQAVYTLTVTPEPGTLGLIAAGVTALAVRSRRRR